MYLGVREIFSRYWRAYGGWYALFTSPYLHLAIFLLGITWNSWCNEEWWEDNISVLPNLLGFSLGGFAMFLSFGDEKFRSILAQKDQDEADSAYLELCSSFVHFIFVQFLALIVALSFRALNFDADLPDYFDDWLLFGRYTFSAIGYLLFLYSLTSLLGATMAVFRICTWYEKSQTD